MCLAYQFITVIIESGQGKKKKKKKKTELSISNFRYLEEKEEAAGVVSCVHFTVEMRLS